MGHLSYSQKTGDGGSQNAESEEREAGEEPKEVAVLKWSGPCAEWVLTYVVALPSKYKRVEASDQSQREGQLKPS